MRNLFEYEFTDSDETVYPAQRFIYASVDNDMQEEIDRSFSVRDYAENASKMPKWTVAVRRVALLMAIFFAKVIYDASKNIGFEQVFDGHFYLFMFGAGCLGIAAALYGVQLFRYLRVKHTGILNVTSDVIQEQTNRTKETFGIPPEHKMADIFSYWHEDNGALPDILMNNQIRLYEKDGKLCIAFIDKAFAFPIDGFTRYLLMKKKVHFDEWNKPDTFFLKEYRKYKIQYDEQDGFSCRCYRLQYADVFGEYELLFPEYELAQFKAIADVPVEKE